MATYLIYDDRERAVAPFIESKFTDVPTRKHRPVTGDYHICKDGKVVACLERKTHQDFANSFRDGRYENLQKLLRLRDATGCQLYFIIEGAAFPALSRRFARIPYKCILGAITKLMVRHGIMIVQTENQQHTAERLYDLAVAFSEEKELMLSSPRDAGLRRDRYPVVEAGEAVDDPPMLDAADGEVVNAEDWPAVDAEGVEVKVAPILTIPDEIMAKQPENIEDEIARTWAKLRNGISVVTGKTLSSRFSIRALARKEVSADQIRAIKLPSGKTITKKVAAILIRVRNGEVDACTKLLCGVRGINKTIAACLLGAAGNLSRLCAYSAGAMAMVVIGKGERGARLGVARATRILRHLHYPAEIPAPQSDISGYTDPPKKPKKAKTDKKEAAPLEDSKQLSGEDSSYTCAMIYS
ncbi:MAG: ERCC4 domain-containing protein [Patescibacteria group bacterium]|nr:ERCC4 domain-containing protein [Patescibacteria group bacterium]